MNYIVFDIEFNQPTFFGKKKFVPNPIAPFEIIEIGAVKLDEQLNIVDTFEALIKPKIYKIMSPIVMRKTKITKEELEKGLTFCSTLKAFKKWIGDDYALCTWGDSDITEMERNCKYHKVKCLNVDNIINLQKLYMYKYELPTGQQIGLKTALEQQNIGIESRLHRALNDALYTALVFQKIFDEELLVKYRKNLEKKDKKRVVGRYKVVNGKNVQNS